MDKVRLPEGDSLYLEITDYRDFEVLRSSLVCSATNLLELNDLAERLSRLNEVQRIAFEGTHARHDACRHTIKPANMACFNNRQCKGSQK